MFFSRHTSLPKELMGASQLRQAMAWQRVDKVEEVVSPFPPEGGPTQVRTTQSISFRALFRDAECTELCVALSHVQGLAGLRRRWRRSGCSTRHGLLRLSPTRWVLTHQP